MCLQVAIFYNHVVSPFDPKSSHFTSSASIWSNSSTFIISNSSNVASAGCQRRALPQQLMAAPSARLSTWGKSDSCWNARNALRQQRHFVGSWVFFKHPFKTCPWMTLTWSQLSQLWPLCLARSDLWWAEAPGSRLGVWLQCWTGQMWVNKSFKK